MARRYRKRPVSRSSLEPTPFERGLPTLELGDGDLTQEALLAVTEDQEARFFMRRVRREINPEFKYSHRYEGENAQVTPTRDYGDIRRFHRVYVGEKDWDEWDFLLILDYLLGHTDAPLSHHLIMKAHGRLQEIQARWNLIEKRAARSQRLREGA